MPAGEEKLISFLIRAPQDNTVASSAFDEVQSHALYKKSASFFEEVFRKFHESSHGKTCSFEIIATSQNIGFCFTAEREVAEVLKALVYSVSPAADIVRIKDPLSKFSGKSFTSVVDVRLKKNSLFPIKCYDEIDGDSLAGLLNILCKLQAGETAFIQVLTTPKMDTGLHQASIVRGKAVALWKQNARLKYLIKRHVKGEVKEKVNGKAANRLYSANIRIATNSTSSHGEAAEVLSGISRTLSSYNTLDLNEFVSKPYKDHGAPAYLKARKLTKPFLLSCKELATIYHLPTERVCPSLLHVISHREPPPNELPIEKGSSDISFFGRTNFRAQHFDFGMKRADRRRHLYCLGKSGVGKSKLMELLIQSDINHGHGVGVLDPHGDLVDNVLRMVPEHRIKDVVIFDPSDLDFPPAFNPLETVPDAYKMRVTIGFIEIFKKIFGDSWTPRLEHVLRYTTLALLDSPDTTVLSIVQMLTDKNYRQLIVRNIKDDVVKSFWVNEFSGWSEKFDNEAITPLMNKVGQFVSTNMIRNIVGQPENKFDFREIMDSRKILLMKISKGILGEENSSLLGAMAITKIYQSAMSRADIREEDRKDFYFYVDEFQNFATDTFDEILSESRKYRLCLTIANQFLGQLEENIKSTVFGNTGSSICFRIGGEDAVHMAEEYAPRFSQRDLINLGVRDFVTKLSIDGETFEAFSAKTLKIEYPEQDFSNQCLAWSRENYASPLSKVEEILGVKSSDSSESTSKEPVKQPIKVELDEPEFDEPLI